jgi:hypothetical protein
MTKADEFNALTEEYDAFAEDTRALVAAAATVRGQLDATGQAALDSLTAKLAERDAAAGV